MFRIITYSIDHLAEDGTPVSEELAFQLEFQGFDHNDALEAHMAGYVDFLMRDDRWTELHPQLERHDNGNSHSPTLDTYLPPVGSPECEGLTDGECRRAASC